MLFDTLSLITVIIGGCLIILLLYITVSKNYSILNLMLIIAAFFIAGVSYCLILIREGQSPGGSSSNCKLEQKVNNDLKTINDYLITLAPHFHLVDKDMTPVTYSGIDTCC